MFYDPDLASELVSASKQAAAVSRGIATESRKLSEDTRRHVSQTYEKIRDTFAYLYRTNESYRKLTGFLQGGNGTSGIPPRKIGPGKKEQR